MFVQYNKFWEINTREDYDNAMKALADQEFIANMTDDHMVWRRETEEIDAQRAQVRAAATEKGLL